MPNLSLEPRRRGRMAVARMHSRILDSRRGSARRYAHQQMKPLVLILLVASAAHGAEAFNPEPFKQASVVLRVRRDRKGAEVRDKYYWPVITIKKVFKNNSKAKFQVGGRADIALHNLTGKLPLGEFTIYLEPFNTSTGAHWTLLGGSADKGLSHVIPLPTRMDCPVGTHETTGLRGIPFCCKDGAICD